MIQPEDMIKVADAAREIAEKVSDCPVLMVIITVEADKNYPTIQHLNNLASDRDLERVLETLLETLKQEMKKDKTKIN